MVAWEAERARLLADLRARQEQAEKRLAATAALCERWGHQRQEELARVRDRLTAAEQLRQEYAALRTNWGRRQTALEQRDATWPRRHWPWSSIASSAWANRPIHPPLRDT